MTHEELTIPEAVIRASLVHEHECTSYKLTDAEHDTLAEADGIKAVTTPTDYEYAVETIAGLKKLLGGIERFYKPIRAAFNVRKQAVLDREYAQSAGPGAHAMRIGGLALAWRKQQQQREHEIRTQAEAEARRVAEEQRQKDVRRLQELADAQAKVDAEMGQALHREAEVLAAAPVIPSKVVIESKIARVRGTSIPKTWSAEVSDIKLLCKAVAEGAVSEEAVQGNMPFLNAQAVALKASLGLVYPGVMAVENETIAGRRS